LVTLAAEDVSQTLTADKHHSDILLSAKRPQILKEYIGESPMLVQLGVYLVELIQDDEESPSGAADL
jgi:hypothetical protein